MSNASVFIVKIISASGEVSEKEFSQAQAEAATAPVLSLRSSDIAEIKLVDPDFDLFSLVKLVELENVWDLRSEPVNADALKALEFSETFPEIEEWEEGYFSELTFAPRYVKVVGASENLWLWNLNIFEDKPLTVLVGNEGPYGVQTIAEYSWFSESAGAPVSWDGGAILHKFPGNVFVDITFGDLESALEVWVTNGSSDELVRVLKEFSMRESRIADVAIALEAKIEQGIPEADANKLAVLLEDFMERSSIGFNVSANEIEKLKLALSSDSEIYRRLKDFFFDPLAENNSGIWQAFQKVSDTGATGAITATHPSWI